MFKKCSQCKQIKDAETGFSKGDTRDGYRYICKSCISKYFKKYYRQHHKPERFNAKYHQPAK